LNKYDQLAISQKRNAGSGKTLMSVRDMHQENYINTYSNIKTKFNNQININPSMIVKKELVDYKKNKVTGSNDPIYKFKPNLEYWQKATKKQPINIVIDEAHSIFSSRKSMSRLNQCIGDWIALVRRIVGENDQYEGELIMITQLWHRLDRIIREMATQIRYHKCHYMKTCMDCGISWNETSEMAEKYKQCPMCLSRELFKHSYMIEIWKFKSMDNYVLWNSGYSGSKGSRPYYQHYFVKNIEQYFPMYSTMQISDLFSEYY
jgi:DNA-directed RNA polymerase subunit RPC12/RpoP